MCPVHYELSGLSFVEFKLFSNAPVFEKEQTAQLVYENKSLEDLQVIELVIDIFLEIYFHGDKFRNLLHVRRAAV